MGLLSKVWGGITKGLRTVFSPVLAPLAKMMSTGWGKALMLALSVFTMGGALLAAGQSFTAGLAGTIGNTSGGFINAFVQGGEAFLKTMVGMETDLAAMGGTTAGNAAEKVAGMNKVNATQDAAAMTDAAATTTNVAESSLQAGMQGGGKVPNPVGGSEQLLSEGAASGAAEKVSNVGKMSDVKAAAGAAKTAAPTEGGNWLSKAASSAKEYLKSEHGQEMIGDIIGGIGEAGLQEDRQQHEDRIYRRWRNDDAKGQEELRNFKERGFDTPDMSGGFGKSLERNRRGFKPTIGFKRQPAGG